MCAKSPMLSGNDLNGATGMDRAVQIPFFRPSITEAEIAEVVRLPALGLADHRARGRGGSRWASRRRSGAEHAVAVNSCTAALHLAVEALACGPGQAVLVPTMTFAATAEVVRYQGAVPLLVDCDPVTLNMDLADAERKLDGLARRAARRWIAICPVVGIMPGARGRMTDATWRPSRVLPPSTGCGWWRTRPTRCPAAYRRARGGPWRRCGEKHRRGHLLLVLRQQDHHDRRGGDGGTARCGTGPPHAADVAPRALARRLETVLRRAAWDYRIVAPGLQVQPDRHRGGDRHPPAGTGRGDAAGAGAPGLPLPARAGGRRRQSNCPPNRRTESIPGTCSPSVCGSTGCRIDRNVFIER